MLKNCNIKNKFTIKEIQAMLKIIPNGFPVTLEDLKEIYSQDDIRQVARRSNED